MTLIIAVAGAMAGHGQAAVQPCTIATKGDSPVARACADGGITLARRTMRELRKRARATGLNFQCEDCHKNEAGYELTAQARESFRKLLAAAETER
jgi:hypothetical protein